MIKLTYNLINLEFLCLLLSHKHYESLKKYLRNYFGSETINIKWNWSSRKAN